MQLKKTPPKNAFRMRVVTSIAEISLTESTDKITPTRSGHSSIEDQKGEKGRGDLAKCKEWSV